MKNIGSIICVKNWELEDEIVFIQDWDYPIEKMRVNGETKVISYLICNDDISIWFHSGSEYFDIGFSK